VFAVVVLVAWHLHAAFRASPASFPVLPTTPSPRLPTEPPRIGYSKSKEAKR
jgi:hypothetical protein